MKIKIKIKMNRFKTREINKFIRVLINCLEFVNQKICRGEEKNMIFCGFGKL